MQTPTADTLEPPGSNDFARAVAVIEKLPPCSRFGCCAFATHFDDTRSYWSCEAHATFDARPLPYAEELMAYLSGRQRSDHPGR